MRNSQSRPTIPPMSFTPPVVPLPPSSPRLSQSIHQSTSQPNSQSIPQSNPQSAPSLESITDLLGRVKELLSFQIYDSAETLCGFLFTLCTETVATGPSLKADVCMCYGDALKGMTSYRRSLHFYSSAITFKKASAVGCSPRSQHEGTDTLVNFEILIKLKQVHCYISLDLLKDALNILESIPVRLRTFPVNLQLGNLYKRLGMERAAVQCYNDVVKVNAYVVEAFGALFELRQWEAVEKGGAMKVFLKDNQPWLKSYLTALAYSENHEFHKAYDINDGLLNSYFKDNVALIVGQGKLSVTLRKPDEALKLFRHSRTIDPLNLTCMDTYASILRTRVSNPSQKLSDLSASLLAVDMTRPEGWIVLSLYYETIGDKAQALALAEKAVSLDDTHCSSYLLKGYMQLSSQPSQPEASLVSYRRAYQLKKEVMSFQGLVEANLALGRYKEAYTYSKEAIDLMPWNAKALTMVGVVLSRTATGVDKGRKALQKAIAADPKLDDALIALVHLEINDGNLKTAKSLLDNQIKIEKKEIYHVKLGDVCELLNEYAEAIINYNLALAINPMSESAKEGLERLQSKLSSANGGASADDAMLDDDMDDG